MLEVIQKKYPDFNWIMEENLAPPPSLQIMYTLGGEHLQRKWRKAVSFVKQNNEEKNKEMFLTVAGKIVNNFTNNEEMI